MCFINMQLTNIDIGECIICQYRGILMNVSLPLPSQAGYENLCCLRCIQPRDTNFGTNCVCRVPKSKLESVSHRDYQGKFHSGTGHLVALIIFQSHSQSVQSRSQATSTGNETREFVNHTESC